MDYIIVAFRSRMETVKFGGLLKNNGIRNEIVNTPKEAGVGCGLSVKVSITYLNTVKRAILISKPQSFAGIFTVKKINNKNKVIGI